MKTKEQLAQEYALENFKEFGGSGRLEIANKSFIAGYEAAQPKWVKVEDGLPFNGKQVIIIQSDKNTLCASLEKDGKWLEWFTEDELFYVTHWCDCIPNFKPETT